MISPLAHLLARWDWHADLLTHFPEPALAVSFVTAIAWLRRNRLSALSFVILALWQLVPLLRFEGRNPVPPDPRSRDRLRVLVANVLHTNLSSEPLLRIIETEQPDVIGIVEFSDSWQSALRRARLERAYPYRLEWPHESEGVALYFRNAPLSIGPVEVPYPGANPVLPATVGFGGRIVTIWLVHPTSPLGERGRGRGRAETLAIAERIKATRTPSIIMGDLNRTECSPSFGDLLQTTGLRDSRLGFGRQRTWPTWSPYRIPIDHVLVSSDLAVTERKLGPPIGSDHLPVIVELAPATGSLVKNESTQGVQSSP
jgi:endonuclease/exonuclease/phosphatase (EEP) superfamily protein YafD